MNSGDWKVRLERFFYERSITVIGSPTLFDHCTISGKDPRVSGRPELHSDLIASIVKGLSLSKDSDVLEVGCASGYIACGLAPKIKRYTGVDLVAAPLEVARRMELSNAKFLKADGASLPLSSNRYDAAFAYDVYTNFPTFADGEPLIRELLRVVKPGGRVMVGSITNKKKTDEFHHRVRQVAERLDAEYGPQPVPKVVRLGLLRRIQHSVSGFAPPQVEPQATTYYFDPDDFYRFAEKNEVHVSVLDVHQLNPYFGFRNNFVFEKPNENC